MPEDARVNTRRAYNISSTGPDRYSATLGAPQGRCIAPANSGSCIQIARGGGVPRTLLIRARWFVRLDTGATKRFNLTESKNIEIRCDLLNMFNNINFDPVPNLGTGASIFQVKTAYTDASNTFDPAGGSASSCCGSIGERLVSKELNVRQQRCF